MLWVTLSPIMQALESLLNNYKARHVECLHGTTLPRKYIVVEMWDEYAGLGNQFPSIITGARPCPSCPLVCLWKAGHSRTFIGGLQRVDTHASAIVWYIVLQLCPIDIT